MCDEHAEVYIGKWRKARKPHRCCECHKESIQRGDRYYHAKMLFDRIWWNHSLCQGCMALWDVFKEAHDGCILFGGLSDTISDMQYDFSKQVVMLGMSVEELEREEHHDLSN